MKNYIKIIFYLFIILSDSLKISANENFNIDFLIIGAQKSGTTSLFHYLSKHPQILVSKNKEVNFFNNNFEKGLNWYSDQFPKKINNYLKVGEASPHYMFDPILPKRAFECFAKIKLIILLRNPIERAFSHYRGNLRLKRETENFDLAIKKDPWIYFSDHQKKTMVMDMPLNYFSYLSRGVYIDQIKHWREFFPEKQFLIILFDDLIKNPEKTVNKVFKFLELTNFKLDKYEIFNEDNEYPNLTMKEETKQRLSNFFAKYNKELEEYLNIKLPW